MMRLYFVPLRASAVIAKKSHREKKKTQLRKHREKMDLKRDIKNPHTMEKKRGAQGMMKYEIFEFRPTHPDGCPGFVALLELALAFAVKSGAILRNPVWTKKSHTRLVLLTSILTKSRASRRRSFPPLLAYSLTSVSLITR